MILPDNYKTLNMKGLMGVIKAKIFMAYYNNHI